MSDRFDRRTLLKTAGAAGIVGLAGCIGEEADDGGDGESGDGGDEGDGEEMDEDEDSGDGEEMDEDEGSGDDGEEESDVDTDLPIIVPDGLIDGTLPDEVGNDMENVWGTSPAAGGPGAERFAELYQEEYDAEPGVFNSQAYDAAAVVILANVAAGENDGTAIRDHMRVVANPPGTEITADNLAEGVELAAQGEPIQYVGASSSVVFNETGDMEAVSYDISRYGGGGIETLRSIDFESSGEPIQPDVELEANGQDRTVEYGILIAETGDLGPLGTPIADAAELPALQLQDQVDIDINVTRGDTQTDPQAGISEADSMVSAGIPAIVGPASSNVNLQVTRQSLIPNGVVGISPSSTAPEVSQLDDDDYIFRTAPSDALQGPVIAQVATEEFDPSETCSTMFLNDNYGQALENAFATAFEEEQGGDVLEQVSFEPQQASYSSELNTALEADPDFLWIVGFPQSGIQIFRDFYNLG